MKKIIAEILQLVWKVLRVYVWKLIAPYLGKIAFVAFLGFAVLTILVMLLFGAC